MEGGIFLSKVHPKWPMKTHAQFNEKIVCKFFMKIILRNLGEIGYIKSIKFTVDWRKI
jgi:hypothetical protein